MFLLIHVVKVKVHQSESIIIKTVVSDVSVAHISAQLPGVAGGQCRHYGSLDPGHFPR